MVANAGARRGQGPGGPGGCPAASTAAHSTSGGAPLATKALAPGLASEVARPGAHRLGLLRIRSFEVPSIDAFVAEVAKLARSMPPDGLVVDLRGNGGGAIQAAERLLQLFTPGRVENTGHLGGSPAGNRVSLRCGIGALSDVGAAGAQ